MVTRSEQFVAYCFGISMCTFRVSIALGNIFFALGILGCGYILYRQMNNHRLNLLSNDMKIPYKVYGLMLVTIIPSILFSIDIGSSVKVFFDMWIYRSLMFLTIPLFVHNRKLLGHIFIAFIAVEAIEGCVATWQVLTLQLGRGVGFNKTVLEYAGMLAILMPALIVGILDKNVDLPIRKACIVLFLFLVAGAIAGQSRGLWLTILVVSPIVLFKYVIRNKKYLVIIGLIIATILGGFVNSPELIHRVESITNMTTDRSNADRLLLWESSINMIKDHPFVGVGVGNWDTAYEDHYKLESITQKHLNHSHNNYLQIMSESGVLGLAGFLIFTVYMIWGNFSEWMRNKNPYALMLFAAWFGFSAFGIIDNTIGGSANAKTLWYVTGILLALKENWNKLDIIS